MKYYLGHFYDFALEFLLIVNGFTYLKAQWPGSHILPVFYSAYENRTLLRKRNKNVKEKYLTLF